VFSKGFLNLCSQIDSIPQALNAALGRCYFVGLSHELPAILPNIIFGQYEAFARSTHQEGHLALDVLRKICNELAVIVVLVAFALIDLKTF